MCVCVLWETISSTIQVVCHSPIPYRKSSTLTTNYNRSIAVYVQVSGIYRGSRFFPFSTNVSVSRLSPRYQKRIFPKKDRHRNSATVA